MSKTNKRKKDVFYEIMAKIDVPPSAYGRSRIELDGGREFIADGCESVLYYGEDRISLKLCDMIADIEGEGLMLTGFGEKNVVIKGIICRIGISGC